MNNLLLKEKQAELKFKPNIRELTLINGIGFPSDMELIMLILGKGTKDNPVHQMAKEVISVINGSSKDNLVTNLMLIPGIGETKALSIAAAIEFGRRRSEYTNAKISSPTDILPYVTQYALETVEHFICITINGSHQIIEMKLISKGTPSKTLIHPREVLEPAIISHASAIIVCHNHPSGTCFPSQADIESTKLLQQSCDTLGISFLDHIIVSKEGHFSFLEHNLL